MNRHLVSNHIVQFSGEKRVDLGLKRKRMLESMGFGQGASSARRPSVAEMVRQGAADLNAHGQKPSGAGTGASARLPAVLQPTLQVNGLIAKCTWWSSPERTGRFRFALAAHAELSESAERDPRTERRPQQSVGRGRRRTQGECGHTANGRSHRRRTAHVHVRREGIPPRKTKKVTKLFMFADMQLFLPAESESGDYKGPKQPTVGYGQKIVPSSRASFLVF